MLQIENEFYAGIRPKRIGQRGERPARALQRYGVEYVEMRLFDVNPMVDVGVAPEQSTFADILLLMCLFRDSPPISPREQAENDENKHRVVNFGRQPDLHLLVHNREQPFRGIAHELFDDMLPFADMLDAGYGGTRYAQTLRLLRGRVSDPDSTPSAQILQAIPAYGSYFAYTMALSRAHRESLLAAPLPPGTDQRFTDAAAASLKEQQALEAQDSVTFEAYREAYFA